MRKKRSRVHWTVPEALQKGNADGILSIFAPSRGRLASYVKLLVRLVFDLVERQIKHTRNNPSFWLELLLCDMIFNADVVEWLKSLEVEINPGCEFILG